MPRGHRGGDYFRQNLCKWSIIDMMFGDRVHVGCSDGRLDDADAGPSRVKSLSASWTRFESPAGVT